MSTLGNKVRKGQRCLFSICNVNQMHRQLIPLISCERQSNCRFGTFTKTKSKHRLLNQRYRITRFLRPNQWFSTSTNSSEEPTTHTTVDEDELKKFTKLAATWWDEKGEFYALHSMNRLRIPLIRDALSNIADADTLPLMLPLKNKSILDVGSGGGILTEPLARLGATMTSVDMVEENIKIAQAHLIQDPEIVNRVKYIHGAVEDMIRTEEGTFDAVVSSEVVEHVSDVETFISSCCKLLKPSGSLFITTLNKTYLSYGLAVFGAEQLLRVVPPGTHDWNKFVSPEDLQLCLEQNGMTVKLIHGMCYNPVTNRWSWISNTDVNYAIHAVKSTTQTIEQTDY